MNVDDTEKVKHNNSRPSHAGLLATGAAMPECL
jgi:hypothetical protein